MMVMITSSSDSDLGPQVGTSCEALEDITIFKQKDPCRAFAKFKKRTAEKRFMAKVNEAADDTYWKKRQILVTWADRKEQR